eukprot:TRINITY_DN13933_c0_g1_i1.p1 TRINITY_DN13933_c0_g1~~TRINITY_DN13933_c0_g1_i1.p1  ORF type:complete len:271 (+),score=37.37 TRINITY_DN13933_c0_g1_i1:127-939(+)
MQIDPRYLVPYSGPVISLRDEFPQATHRRSLRPLPQPRYEKGCSRRAARERQQQLVEGEKIEQQRTATRANGKKAERSEDYRPSRYKEGDEEEYASEEAHVAQLLGRLRGIVDEYDKEKVAAAEALSRLPAVPRPRRERGDPTPTSLWTPFAAATSVSTANALLLPNNNTRSDVLVINSTGKTNNSNVDDLFTGFWGGEGRTATPQRPRGRRHVPAPTNRQQGKFFFPNVIADLSCSRKVVFQEGNGKKKGSRADEPPDVFVGSLSLGTL